MGTSIKKVQRSVGLSPMAISGLPNWPALVQDFSRYLDQNLVWRDDGRTYSGYVRVAIVSDDIQDNAEGTSITTARGEAGSQVRPSDTEMKAFFNASGKSAVSDLPQSLDLGSPANLYGKDNVIAKTPEPMHIIDMREAVRPSGADVADTAKYLGTQYADRWHDPTPTGKCNVFADAAIRGSGAKLPWDENHVPTVDGMMKQLKQHPEDWGLVYSDHPGKDFSRFQSQPGDFMLRDKTVTPPSNDTVYNSPYHVEHCGIADGEGLLHYAGSMDTHGYNSLPIFKFNESPHYRAPTAVYRYKHLRE